MPTPRREIDSILRGFTPVVEEFKGQIAGKVGPKPPELLKQKPPDPDSLKDISSNAVDIRVQGNFFPLQASKEMVRGIQERSPNFAQILSKIREQEERVGLILKRTTPPTDVVSFGDLSPEDQRDVLESIDEVHQLLGSRIIEIEDLEASIVQKREALQREVSHLNHQIDSIQKDAIFGIEPTVSQEDLQREVDKKRDQISLLNKDLEVFSEEKAILATFFSVFYDSTTTISAIKIARADHQENLNEEREVARLAEEARKEKQREAEERQRKEKEREADRGPLVRLLELHGVPEEHLFAENRAEKWYHRERYLLAIILKTAYPSTKPRYISVPDLFSLPMDVPGTDKKYSVETMIADIVVGTLPDPEERALAAKVKDRLGDQVGALNAFFQKQKEKNAEGGARSKEKLREIYSETSSQSFLDPWMWKTLATFPTLPIHTDSGTWFDVDGSEDETIDNPGEFSVAQLTFEMYRDVLVSAVQNSGYAWAQAQSLSTRITTNFTKGPDGKPRPRTYPCRVYHVRETHGPRTLAVKNQAAKEERWKRTLRDASPQADSRLGDDLEGFYPGLWSRWWVESVVETNQYMDELDSAGKPIYKTDDFGNVVLDSSGKPIIDTWKVGSPNGYTALQKDYNPTEGVIKYNANPEGEALLGDINPALVGVRQFFLPFERYTLLYDIKTNTFGSFEDWMVAGEYPDTDPSGDLAPTPIASWADLTDRLFKNMDNIAAGSPHLAWLQHLGHMFSIAAISKGELKGGSVLNIAHVDVSKNLIEKLNNTLVGELRTLFRLIDTYFLGFCELQSAIRLHKDDEKNNALWSKLLSNKTITRREIMDMPPLAAGEERDPYLDEELGLPSLVGGKEKGIRSQFIRVRMELDKPGEVDIKAHSAKGAEEANLIYRDPTGKIVSPDKAKSMGAVPGLEYYTRAHQFFHMEPQDMVDWLNEDQVTSENVKKGAVKANWIFELDGFDTMVISAPATVKKIKKDEVTTTVPVILEPKLLLARFLYAQTLVRASLQHDVGPNLQSIDSYLLGSILSSEVRDNLVNRKYEGLLKHLLVLGAKKLSPDQQFLQLEISGDLTGPDLYTEALFEQVLALIGKKITWGDFTKQAATITGVLGK